MRVIVLISFLFLAACEKKTGLGLDLKHIVKSSYEKPGKNCRKLTSVTGFTVHNAGFARSYQKSLAAILKHTHETGGNFVFIKRASTDGTNLNGISYACN